MITPTILTTSVGIVPILLPPPALPTRETTTTTTTKVAAPKEAKKPLLPKSACVGDLIYATASADEAVSFIVEFLNNNEYVYVNIDNTVPLYWHTQFVHFLHRNYFSFAFASGIVVFQRSEKTIRLLELQQRNWNRPRLAKTLSLQVKQTDTNGVARANIRNRRRKQLWQPILPGEDTEV